jgi:hypothetical protein
MGGCETGSARGWWRWSGGQRPSEAEWTNDGPLMRDAQTARSPAGVSSPGASPQAAGHSGGAKALDKNALNHWGGLLSEMQVAVLSRSLHLYYLV